MAEGHAVMSLSGRKSELSLALEAMQAEVVVSKSR